jgi:ribosomal protein S1
VVKVVPFGAFVELTDDIDGFLHESEWSVPPQVGSRFTVRIKAVDVEKRRVSLELA